jgi:hypothetical protein
MRLYREETLSIRINAILKHKFAIATWFSWVSARINTFMSDYVRDYEKQYWVIPMTINAKEKYDVITKFFWVKVNKKLFKEYEIKDTCKLINEIMGTNITENEMEFFIQNYPKTRTNEGYNIMENWEIKEI